MIINLMLNFISNLNFIIITTLLIRTSGKQRLVFLCLPILLFDKTYIKPSVFIDNYFKILYNICVGDN